MKEFLENLKSLHKLASTWVTFLITTAAAFWITLPLDTQVELQTQFPTLKYLMLLFAFIAFAIARATPQGSKTEDMSDGN